MKGRFAAVWGKMLKKILVYGNITAFFLFIYGAYYNFLQMEPNSCQMTYMFRNPQFKKIPVSGNKFFSNYGLYYYYEGLSGNDIRSLNGAPVLFVPGNGGSFRQVRSLASVSLQKALQYGNKIHLDYFTIDYDEELSAFYGGYLEKQKKFLQLCIRKIIQMYKKPSNERVKIVIIGHSMGGIVAESILKHTGELDDFVEHILSIIFLSTPLERPVLNFDWKMNQFYEHTNQMLQEKRNLSGEKDSIMGAGSSRMQEQNAYNDILLISIGGGERDLQVPAWLTTSKFSNIHAMTSAIPKVWLSCDHLSIVWCLQLMKVINRFLYSILVRKPENYVVYEENFDKNMQSAYKHFIGAESGRIESSNQIDFDKLPNNTIWRIEPGERGSKTFKNGVKQTFIQLMPLIRSVHAEKMYIQVTKTGGNEDWLLGGIAFEDQTFEMTFEKVFSLSHYISYLPTEQKQTKSYALIDLQEIMEAYPDWTHIFIRLTRTSTDDASFHFDIHRPEERVTELNDYTERSIEITTPEGAAYTRLIIEDISLSYYAFQLNFRKLDCSAAQSDIVVRTSASWASGFDQYYVFPAKDQEMSFDINVPIEIAPTRDDSLNRVYVDVHLSPSYRLAISSNMPLQHSLKRIARRFSLHLPAHIIAIMIVVISQHLSSELLTVESLLITAAKEYFQWKSMFIVTACHLLQHFAPNEAIPGNAVPFFVSILLHGAATVLGIILVTSFLVLLKLTGYVLGLIVPRINLNLPLIFTSRHIFGIIIVGISSATCCGLGMLFAFLAYFLWLSNQCIGRTRSYEKGEEEFELSPVEQRRIFLVHVQLLQLLVVLIGLNGVEVMAWVIKYPNPCLDRQWLVNVVTLVCWMFLWETESFAHINVFGRKTVSICLCGIAAYCLLYGQEFLYTLNYTIASVYISLLFVTSLCNLWHFCQSYSDTKSNG